MKRRFIVIGLFLAAALTLAAIGISAQDGDEEDTYDPLAVLENSGLTVRSLDDVTESPEQILDLRPDSARLNFVGTIPLACTILFGTDTDFGRASVDPDMNGATIIEHNPLMLDLEPDTEYFYRIQGSAEDGTFYVGEIMSFRTPPLSDELPDNLLSPQRGAEVIDVSSNFGGAANDENWGVLRAFDGNLNTAWSTDGDGDEGWFEVALDGTYNITRLEFETRIMADDSSQVMSFTITDAAGNVYGPFDVPEPGENGVYEVDFVTSALRLDFVTTSGGNTGAMEIGAFGEPAE